jgi:nicotinamidase-related amidase
MTAALLIIDMQQGSFTETSPKHDVDALVLRLNGLAQAVRAADGVVIFVQHDGPEGDPHHPDLPGWHLLPGLRVRDGDVFLRKRSCDAFLRTELDDVLRARGIGQLIITGCTTDYCVDTTVRSALARPYTTIVPIDGHTTSDRPHLSAVQIMAHHHAIWSDFIAPGGPAVLCRCEELPRLITAG